MKLTQKEITILLSIAKHAVDACCDEPKDLLDDNFSWFNLKDMEKLTPFTKHEISGLISSLYIKDLISESDGDWFLTEEGISESQILWEQNDN